MTFNKTVQKMNEDMNKLKKEAEDRHKEKLNRLKPIAIDILKIIIEKGPIIGDTTEIINGKQEVIKEVKESRQEQAVAILKKLLSENIKYVEKDTIKQLLIQAIEEPLEVALQALSDNYDVALTRLFGCSLRDLELNKIDEILKKPIEKEEVKE